MKNLTSYREILVKKNFTKPQYLWFKSFGSFLYSNRSFIDKKVLDFGCDINSNAFKQFLAQSKGNPLNYYGFDLSNLVIEWLKDNNYYYDFWNDDSIQFDSINASQVYEHLDEEYREKFIQRSYTLLKPGGILYIDIPYIANLNIIEFFRRDRTHKAVACEDEALYIEQFNFDVDLYVGGYTIPYYGLFMNLYRVFTNLILGYKPFLVTFIVAKKRNV